MLEESPFCCSLCSVPGFTIVVRDVLDRFVMTLDVLMEPQMSVSAAGQGEEQPGVEPRLSEDMDPAPAPAPAPTPADLTHKRGFVAASQDLL